MEILCTKGPSGALLPMDDEQAAKVAKLKAGSVLRVDVTQVRNGRFFRKFWVLAQFAFDIWSDTMPRQQYRGQEIQPNFERFRKELVILAGYFTPVWNVAGELRVEAKSISWAKMGEEEFEALFSACINAVLGKILSSSRFTEAQIRAHVDRVLQFD